jgi:hypothetical protein
MTGRPRPVMTRAWAAARWVIWPPHMPLWAQFVYKAAQLAGAAALLAGSVPEFAAALALIIAVAWVAADRAVTGQPAPAAPCGGWCHRNHCGCDWPTRHPCETCDCSHSATRRQEHTR